jgi:hypothetical protein
MPIIYGHQRTYLIFLVDYLYSESREQTIEARKTHRMMEPLSVPAAYLNWIKDSTKSPA